MHKAVSASQHAALETYCTVRLETPPLHLTEHSLQAPTCQMEPEQEAAVQVLDSCEPAHHKHPSIDLSGAVAPCDYLAMADPHGKQIVMGS